MKYILFIISIFFIFSLNSVFSQSNNIDETLKLHKIEYCYEYLQDNNYCFNYVNIFPHKTIIKKIYSNRLRKNNKILSIDSYDSISLDFILKEASLIESKKYEGDLVLYVYKIPNSDLYSSFLEGYTDNIKINNSILLYIIKDKYKIIWDYIWWEYPLGWNNHPRVINAKKIDDLYAIAFFNGKELYIDYIYNFDKPLIIDILLGGSFGMESLKSNIDSCEFISDKIIKLSFKESDNIEYWRVKKTNVDESRLIWSNFIDNRGKFIMNNYKSSLKEYDNEPSTLQLKEKFPDDTFFR
ncbi:MAG: hypothetical protein IJS60_10310 [Abditibacteriota bacterium]|nr:hypothetical protein [Abditibacteriota bacterium]